MNRTYQKLAATVQREKELSQAGVGPITGGDGHELDGHWYGEPGLEAAWSSMKLQLRL